MELSPLYRTFQVYKFGNRKYNFLLNYFVVLNVLGLHTENRFQTETDH